MPRSKTSPDPDAYLVKRVWPLLEKKLYSLLREYKIIPEKGQIGVDGYVRVFSKWSGYTVYVSFNIVPRFIENAPTETCISARVLIRNYSGAHEKLYPITNNPRQDAKEVLQLVESSLNDMGFSHPISEFGGYDLPKEIVPEKVDFLNRLKKESANLKGRTVLEYFVKSLVPLFQKETPSIESKLREKLSILSLKVEGIYVEAVPMFTYLLKVPTEQDDPDWDKEHVRIKYGGGAKGFFPFVHVYYSDQYNEEVADQKYYLCGNARADAESIVRIICDLAEQHSKLVANPMAEFEGYELPDKVTPEKVDFLNRLKKEADLKDPLQYFTRFLVFRIEGEMRHYAKEEILAKLPEQDLRVKHYYADVTGSYIVRISDGDDSHTEYIRVRLPMKDEWSVVVQHFDYLHETLSEKTLPITGNMNEDSKAIIDEILRTAVDDSKFKSRNALEDFKNYNLPDKITPEKVDFLNRLKKEAAEAPDAEQYFIKKVLPIIKKRIGALLDKHDIWHGIRGRVDRYKRYSLKTVLSKHVNILNNSMEWLPGDAMDIAIWVEGKAYPSFMYAYPSFIYVEVENVRNNESSLNDFDEFNVITGNPEQDATQTLEVLDRILSDYFGQETITEFEGHELPDKIVPEKVDFLHRLKKESAKDFKKYFYDKVIPAIRANLANLLPVMPEGHTGVLAYTSRSNFEYKFEAYDRTYLIEVSPMEEMPDRGLFSNLITVLIEENDRTLQYAYVQTEGIASEDGKAVVDQMEAFIRDHVKESPEPITEFSGYKLPEKVVPEKVDFLNRLKKEAAKKPPLDYFIAEVVPIITEDEEFFSVLKKEKFLVDYKTPPGKGSLYIKVVKPATPLQLGKFETVLTFDVSAGWLNSYSGEAVMTVDVYVGEDRKFKEGEELDLTYKPQEDADSIIEVLLAFLSKYFSITTSISKFEGYDLPEKVVPEKIDFLNRLKKEAKEDPDRYFVRRLLPAIKNDLETIPAIYGFPNIHTSMYQDGRYWLSLENETGDVPIRVILDLGGTETYPKLFIHIRYEFPFIERWEAFYLEQNSVEDDALHFKELYVKLFKSFKEAMEGILQDMKPVSEFEKYELPKEITPEKVDFLNRLKKEAQAKSMSAYFSEEVYPVLKEYLETMQERLKVLLSQQNLIVSGSIKSNDSSYSLVMSGYDNAGISHFEQISIYPESKDNIEVDFIVDGNLVAGDTFRALGEPREDAPKALSRALTLVDEHSKFRPEAPMSKFEGYELPEKIVPEKVDFLNRLKKEATSPDVAGYLMYRVLPLFKKELPDLFPLIPQTYKFTADSNYLNFEYYLNFDTTDFETTEMFTISGGYQGFSISLRRYFEEGRETIFTNYYQPKWDEVEDAKMLKEILAQMIPEYLGKPGNPQITEFEGYDLPEKVIPEKVDFLNRLKKEAKTGGYLDTYFHDRLLPWVISKLERVVMDTVPDVYNLSAYTHPQGFIFDITFDTPDSHLLSGGDKYRVTLWSAFDADKSVGINFHGGDSSKNTYIQTTGDPQADAKVICDTVKGFLEETFTPDKFQGYELPKEIVPEKVDFLNRLKKEAYSAKEFWDYFGQQVWPKVKEGIGRVTRLLPNFKNEVWTDMDYAFTTDEANWDNVQQWLSAYPLREVDGTHLIKTQYGIFFNERTPAYLEPTGDPQQDAEAILDAWENFISERFDVANSITEFKGYQLPEKIVPEKIDFLNRLKKEAGETLADQDFYDYFTFKIVPELSKHVPTLCKQLSPDFMKFEETVIKGYDMYQIFANSRELYYSVFIWPTVHRFIQVGFRDEDSKTTAEDCPVTGDVETDTRAILTSLEYLLRERLGSLTKFKNQGKEYELPEKIVPEKIDFLNRLKKETGETA